jgi:glutamate racemase
LLELGVDQLVLGCTHYSFLVPALERHVGSRAQLVDVAAAVARRTRKLAGDHAHGTGKITLRSSAHPERLEAALPRLGLARIATRLNPVSAA